MNTEEKESNENNEDYEIYLKNEIDKKRKESNATQDRLNGEKITFFDDNDAKNIKSNQFDDKLKNTLNQNQNKNLIQNQSKTENKKNKIR